MSELRDRQRAIIARIAADIAPVEQRDFLRWIIGSEITVRDFGDKIAYPRDRDGILPHELALPLIERLMEFYRRVTPEEIEILSAHVTEPQPQPVKQVKPKTYPGYVYLIRAENGIYKIGRTAVPEDRTKTFAVKLPFEIEYTALIKTDDMHGLERQLHLKFAAKRGNGEWFALDADDVAYIKSLAVQS